MKKVKKWSIENKEKVKPANLSLLLRSSYICHWRFPISLHCHYISIIDENDNDDDDDDDEDNDNNEEGTWALQYLPPALSTARPSASWSAANTFYHQDYDHIHIHDADMMMMMMMIMPLDQPPIPF